MIHNLKELITISNSNARHNRSILLEIVDSVLYSLQPDILLKNELKKIDLYPFKRIAIFSIGKAAKQLANAAKNELSRKPAIICLADIGHPLPTQVGIEKTDKLVNEAKKLGKDDLAIVLISGGGSAMFVKPIESVSLEDKINITKKLLLCGANINEINVIRKHLSQVKGGQLARMLYPATVLSFVISDVVGNDLGTIASGPLSPDKSTFFDAINILKKYSIKVPIKINDYLKRGSISKQLETPKPGDIFFNNISIKIIADHIMSANLALKKIKELGLPGDIFATNLSGDCKVTAKQFISANKKRGISIATGETTVAVKGTGYGGRNQEFILSALLDLKPGQALISIGTDGIDGICPEPIAGAVGDADILDKAKRNKIDITKYLKNNDSYNFFKKTNGLIKTGPTDTNVGDLILLYNE